MSDTPTPWWMKAFDNLTGHKSKHYTTQQVLQSEADKRRGALYRQKADNQLGPNFAADAYGQKQPASDGQSFAPEETGSTYGTNYGLQDVANQQEQDAQQKRQAAVDALKASGKMANITNQTNQIADQTRFGGKFSANGLQQADTDATANALDRFKAQQILGIGGTYQMGMY